MSPPFPLFARGALCAGVILAAITRVPLSGAEESIVSPDGRVVVTVGDTAGYAAVLTPP